MIKVSNKVLVMIALLLSLLTAILVYNYLKTITVGKDAGQEVSVIVAKVDIVPKTKITPEMVSEMKVPQEYIQPGAVQTLDKVVGVVAREHIASGEQVSERRLLREGKSVGFTGIIPRDKRAMTVAVTEVTGVAGFIKAGDYADVVVTFDAAAVGDNVSHVIMQNILVLAANRETEMSGPEAPVKENAKELSKNGTVTMAVTPEEAAQLTLAEEKGKIRLVLRPYLPLQSIMLTQAVTPKDLVGIQVSPVKNEKPAAAPPSQAAPPAPVERQEITAKPNASNNGIQVIRGTKIDSGM